MRRLLCCLLGATGACYGVDGLPAGLECGPDRACPSGQICGGDDVCYDPNAPDAPPPPDARPDAPYDADPCDCHDQNTDDGDGCVANCRFARCGDGIVRRAVEQCDDMNTNDSDGCTSACLDCTAAGDARAILPQNHHCYSRHGPGEGFAGAREACSALGRNLAILGTPEEQLVIPSLRGAGVTSMWIGLTDQALEGQYRWVTGEPAEYTNWGLGEPTNTGDCVITTTLDAWAVGQCIDLHPYICEDEPWQLDRKNHAFRVFGGNVSWAVARDACAALGGHLATLTTADEDAWAQALVFRPTWIGLTDQTSEGAFTWVTGEASAYSGWAPIQPDGASAQNCVLLDLDGWQDSPCGDVRPYLCEID